MIDDASRDSIAIEVIGEGAGEVWGGVRMGFNLNYEFLKEYEREKQTELFIIFTHLKEEGYKIIYRKLPHNKS